MTFPRPLFALTLAGLLTTSHAQEKMPLEADVGKAMLAKISAELDCAKAPSPNAVLGCAMLAEFAAAETPDPATFKQGDSLDGQRWLGVTIVSDKSSKPKFAVNSSTPFQCLIVLGARHSGNFHQKLHFANGVGHSYIWAENPRQADMIAQAGQALLKGAVDPASQPARFAQQYDLKFAPVRATTGKSSVIGNDTMVRQRGQMLYVVGIGPGNEGKPIYYVSQIRADTPLR